MDCSALMQIAKPEMLSAAAPNPAAAAQFAELMKQPCAAPSEVYVSTNTGGQAPQQEYALLNFMESVSQGDFGSLGGTSSPSDGQSPGSQGNEFGGDPISAGESVIKAQQEMLKTAIMFEGVNSVRQGASTLFQLQG